MWDNTGDGFRAFEDHPLTRHASNTTGITIGDWDNTGAWNVYVSNMYSHAGRRVLRLTESLGEAMRADLESLAAVEAGQFWLASDALDRAVAASPTSVPAWIDKARAHHARGQIDRARQSYTRALELEPTNDLIRQELDGLGTPQE